MEKFCRFCQQYKPPSEFHKDRSKKDGLNPYCKTCQIARQKDYTARPPRKSTAPEGFKRCQHCKETKRVDAFYKVKSYYDGLNKNCKACSAKFHDKWRKNNLSKVSAGAKKWRDAHPERTRDYSIKQNYGLPFGTYQKMFDEQNGQCAICETATPGGKGSFHVDHCHDAGNVRGLLCHHCNVGIGHFLHRIDLLQSAINYLTKGSIKGRSTFDSHEKLLVTD